MKVFSRLYQNLERSKDTSKRVDLLSKYFSEVSDSDKLWTIALFSQKRPKRIIKPLSLRLWITDLAGIPDWLFEESYNIVGDQAETSALLLPIAKQREEKSLSEWILESIDIAHEEENIIKEWVQDSWLNLDCNERFIFNKLITGTFRINLQDSIIAKALSNHLDSDENVFAHRLKRNWSPLSIGFQELLKTEHYKDYISKPYPFFYGHPLDLSADELEDAKNYIAEWKWDGLRAQLISRDGEIFIWSRNNELINDSFPELLGIPENIDYDFVLDGEIIAFKESKAQHFSETSKRLGKKKVNKRLLQDIPVVFMAYDILEYRAQDVRDTPLVKRKEFLSQLYIEASNSSLKLSEMINLTQWSELDEVLNKARNKKAKGIILKKTSSIYKDGRHFGDWSKIKVKPITVDSILIYAHRNPRQGISTYEEYSFALWDQDSLVTITKASEGLTREEKKEIALYVKQNTIERFGPVYSVNPGLVFEISFDGIVESKRHKSGIVLRNPIISKWQLGKKVEDADSIEKLKNLLI